MKEVEFPKLKPANLAALLPTCVALNYAGGMIRQMLNVPLFLDTGGTLLATFIAGPWVGLLCAALNAVVMAITLGPLQLLTRWFQRQEGLYKNLAWTDPDSYR